MHRRGIEPHLTTIKRLVEAIIVLALSWVEVGCSLHRCGPIISKCQDFFHPGFNHCVALKSSSFMDLFLSRVGSRNLAFPSFIPYLSSNLQLEMQLFRLSALSQSRILALYANLDTPSVSRFFGIMNRTPKYPPRIAKSQRQKQHALPIYAPPGNRTPSHHHKATEAIIVLALSWVEAECSLDRCGRFVSKCLDFYHPGFNHCVALSAPPSWISFISGSSRNSLVYI
ncbi:hypothetical protein C8R47DRAFT_516936 [Mycena vitilis]|nr:hypothetical protein C8R47DRAFT_516936 [Mycena vitilis]